MRLVSCAGIAVSLFLGACTDQEPVALGMLTSERIELVADVTEPIVMIDATEGQQLEAGQRVLLQNDERVAAALQVKQAELRRVKALLAEQLRGPREERISMAQSAVASAQIQRDFREREWQRQEGLSARNLGAAEALDQARVQFELAVVQLETSQTQLSELQAGTTKEELEQTRQHLEQLQAQLQQLEIDRGRHQAVVPMTTHADIFYVDTLPFEIGEQPKKGDVVAVLLTGAQPLARVYVPEILRVNVQPGNNAIVQVDGLDEPLTGTVLRISSDPAFTPYLYLTERDRGRLSYVAEISLPDQSRRLPDGVPVEVIFAGQQ